MFFAIILVRLLFAACMILIIGYVFGNFARSKKLTTMTKVASILAIVLFISANAFTMRFAGWRQGGYEHFDNCHAIQKDSASAR